MQTNNTNIIKDKTFNTVSASDNPANKQSTRIIPITNQMVKANALIIVLFFIA